MMVLVQSSFHTTWAGLFEMELEPNLLDWNVNELECELELKDMKHTNVHFAKILNQFWNVFWNILLLNNPQCMDVLCNVGLLTWPCPGHFYDANSQQQH